MKLQDTITAEFNEFSKNYTEDMTRCVPHYLKLLNCFTENLPSNFKPEHILDLGCGNGNVTSRLVSQFPKAAYTLLDVSDKMLELCQQQFAKYNITCAKSYFQDFEFKKAAYNMVAAGFSVHHCNASEKQDLFKNIHDSLKPGGVFSCSDLMIDRVDKEHLQLIDDWKTFVNKNFPNDEKWHWLMEHYKAHDNPDSLNKHLSWLKQIGFSDFNVSIFDNHWIHFKAFKT